MAIAPGAVGRIARVGSEGPSLWEGIPGEAGACAQQGNMAKPRALSTLQEMRRGLRHFVGGKSAPASRYVSGPEAARGVDCVAPGSV
jgi:hypothetical protein